MIRSRRQTQRLYDVLAYVVLIGAFSFAVFPILWTLLTSLKSNADIVTAEIQYIPLRPNFQNYATLWAQAGFPCVPAFGPGSLLDAHRPNESVAVEDIVLASRIYTLTALRFLGEAQQS